MTLKFARLQLFYTALNWNMQRQSILQDPTAPRSIFWFLVNKEDCVEICISSSYILLKVSTGELLIFNIIPDEMEVTYAPFRQVIYIILFF